MWKDLCMKSDQIEIELQCEIQRALTPAIVSPLSVIHTYCITNLIWERGKTFNSKKNVHNQHETERRNCTPNRKFFKYFFCMCNSNYSISHTLIKQSNQGSYYLVFSFHWLQITLTKLSKAMSGFDNFITLLLLFIWQKLSRTLVIFFERKTIIK